jgi:hypothetical protein
VIFIVKPGRDSYGGPKDYRPISHTSFLLKTMEWLLGRFIRDEIVISSPLYSNQHAYGAGIYTETAVHQLVVLVENALNQKERDLGFFLIQSGRLTTPPTTVPHRQ